MRVCQSHDETTAKEGGAWTTFFNFNLLLLEFFSEKNDPSQCDAAAAGVKN